MDLLWQDGRHVKQKIPIYLRPDLSIFEPLMFFVAMTNCNVLWILSASQCLRLTFLDHVVIHNYSLFHNEFSWHMKTFTTPFVDPLKNRFIFSNQKQNLKWEIIFSFFWLIWIKKRLEKLKKIYFSFFGQIW